MGHKHSRHGAGRGQAANRSPPPSLGSFLQQPGSCASNASFASNASLGSAARHAGAEPAQAPRELQAASPAKTDPPSPFRFEDRGKIPDVLVEGPFEELEIAGDVYSTAYLIARNSGDMYSISPWKNPDVRIVWLFLFFIAGSQLFVILSVTIWYPPVVSSASLHVDCSNVTMLAAAVAGGFLQVASQESCLEDGKFAFEADLRGRTLAYHILERETSFHDAVLAGGDATIQLLRAICCIWVFSQIYLQEFSSIKALLAYHDFSCWFLPVKGETIRHGWTIGIPLIQYSVLLVVTTMSFVIICSHEEAFDIVMNTLAFTFIAEVGSYFNEPLATRMAQTKIQGLDPEDYPYDVLYLYPEYKESNAVNDDGSYTDGGWYILEEEEKAGLLSDYRVRHNAAKYAHTHADRLGGTLDWILWIVPPAVVLLGMARARSLEPGAPLGAPGASGGEL